MQIQRHLFKWILYSFLCWTTGLVQAQIPTLTNARPAEGFIGEQVCFPVTFVNTGAPGFLPYVRLVLPTGFTFDNSSFGGSAQTVQNLGTIVAAAPNNFVLDPVAQSNGNSTTNDTIFAPVGSTVILLEYPVGSMVQGGVSLISEVCVTIDAAATVGVPVDICTQGMYGLGDTPTGANGPIAGANGCEPITPILFRFDKKINGSDGVYNEVPGGGGSLCHIHQYQLNVDIAAAGTLNGPITITDVLPGVLTYLGNISLPAGCSAVEPTVGSLGGSLTITCTGAYPGSTANIDLQVTFDAAVTDTLDEAICDDIDISNNASIAVPGSPSQSDTVITHVEHVLLSHGNNAGSPVTIGQTVLYTISAEITEYTAGLNAGSITFIVPDGMIYNPASLTWAGAPVAAGNVVVVAGPGTGSTVTVDVHAQNGANILPCGSPALQYTADVNQTYSNGAAVLSRDSLRHTSTLTYGLVEGASGCMTSDDSYIEIVDIFFQKTVTNSPPTGPGRNGQWWPGDIVQYRLELQIPSLDLDDVVITDFFPLPVHDVSDLAATFGIDVQFDPASCWTTAPVSYIRDAATNGLILDFGDVSDVVTGGCVDIILLIDIPITTVPFADGTVHSNFMQVNSDNSTGDDITGNSLTLVQIGAPDLELTKGIVSSDNPNVNISPTVVPPNGNATNVNAGDQLFFDITVENTGTAPGYDVQIRDVAPPELTNCALLAPNPVVDGSNNALAFSGGFAGNSLTINLIAPNDSIAFIGAPNGNDLITVSYVCEAVSGIQAGTQFDNTAEVDWSSIRGGTKFSPVDDEASAVIADPTMNKVVDYIFPNYSNTNTQASIGEVVAYEVQLNIPEGNMNNVTLIDQVDEGLAFVGVDSILICNSSGSTNILTSIGGGFNAVRSGAAITSIGVNPQQQDRVLTLDFGNLQNLDTDNIEDTIKIFYQTIVINHVTNFDGERVRNRATMSWDNPNSGGNRSSINERAPFVTIVEPQIEISKSFTPDEVLPGNNSFVTLTLRNPGTATAPAFDVNLTDILPTGMIFVSGFSAGGTASITTPPTNGGGTITAHWDTINVGEVYSITFEVQSSSSITPCFTLTNCANVTWESIAQADEPNMPSAFSSNLGIKRTGNPGNIGGVANTHTQDSCADLDVIIDNTFDPFITANTPLCEGDRVVLSVQQYQGNVVTYNWTGPGVPAGFNNYELVLDPVTTADTGTYFVFVELDGCVTDTSNSFSLQLRPKPVTPTLSPGDTTICEGTSIQFSTTTIENSYTWTGPNGFTANSATTPLISPVTLADAGRYTLFTTNAQGCNSDPIASNLMVTPRPAQPSLGNNSPICSNENIVLTSSASATTYQWLSPNGQDTITTTNTLVLEPNNPLYTAGNWTLMVSDANGCASQASNTTTVVINGTPAAPITSNSGPICEGEDVTLTVNTVSNGAYAWYSDAALTNLVASTQNPVISGLLAANSPDTFYVQVSSNGCLSDTGFTMVQINANPAAVLPNYTPLCSGDTIFLFANAAASTYSWTGPNGFISNLENPFIANSANSNAGSYALSITDANGCSNAGIVQVAVEERPAAPSITSNAPVCAGDNIVLNVASYTGTSVQYTWSTPTGVITTGIPSLNVNNTTIADSGTYSVVVAVDGCISLADSINVIINSNPTAPNVPAAFAVCEGDGITLSTTTNANVYNWSGPNGFASSSPNPSVISPATAANTGTYSLVVQDFNGCTSPVSSTVVTVNSAPAQPAMTTNSAICTGDNLVLSTSAVASAYTWTAPNGADTITTSSTATILPTSNLYQSGNWNLVITDTNGCSSPTSVSSNVLINTIPLTASAGNNGPVCSGSVVQLSAGAVSGASYAWYTDAATTNQFSTLQNPRITNITSDSTFYLLVTINGCTSALDSTIVVVHPLTTAPALPANFTVCEGDNITLSTSTVASTYNWSGPNGFTSTQQNPIVINNATLSNGGIYTLSIVDANGCSSADTSVSITVNPAPAQPAMSTNAAICVGDNLVLSTSTAASSYVWTAPNGADTTTTSSTATIPSTSSLYQSGNWSLVVVDANNCSSIASLASTVIISNGVTATAFNNGPVCSGDAVQLSTTTLSGALYEWYSDAALTNLISTQQNPIITNITTDSTFFLVVTVNGCASTPVATTVTLHPTPATASVPADFVVCEGETIALTTTRIAASYNWTGPNGFTSNLQNPAVIRPATAADAGIYTLSIVDANGCQSADTSVTVGVDIAPAAPVLINNSAICDGDTLMLSTTASADTFRWTSPNGLDTLTTIGSLMVIPSNTTYYQSGDWTLITQIANNCPSQASAASSVVINSTTTAPNIFNDGPVCVGGKVTLSTSNALGASYQWYSDAALTNLIATTASVAINNITTDSTFYLVVSVNGCISPVGSTLVSIIAQPATPAVPADFAVCEGDNIALSSSTIADTYSWTGPNGFTSSLQTPAVITNASSIDAGAYRLMVTYSNGCVSGDTIVQVIVNANPPVPNITSNGPLCFGDTLVLSSSANCIQSQWIGPNGNSQSTLGTPGGGNVLWTFGSTTSIPVNEVNYLPGNWSMICMDTLTGCQTASNTIDVIINANPDTPNVFNNGPVCNGATATLSTASLAGATYAWFSDAALSNLVATTQNPSIVNVTNDTTWYLVVTVNGCSSVAGSTRVIVHPTPATPNVPADFAVCAGDNIILTTNTVATGYNWSGPNGFTSNVQNPVVIANATITNAGIYTLSIIDGNACVSGDTSVNVSVNANPASVTITSNSSICFGDTLTLTSSSDCGQSQWIGPNGNSASTLGTPGNGNVLWTIGSTTNIPSTDANYLSGDWYMICIDTITGCQSESNTINVIIDPIPVVSAFNNGPICAGDHGALSASFIAGAAYNWYSDAALTTLISTVRTPVITNMTVSETYYVVATVNGCTSLADSTTIVVNPTPVMPNPTYTPLCQLDTLFLQANAVGSIATYWWTGPNSFTSNLENPVIPNVYPFNAGSYILTVTDSFGCQAVSTVEVTIYPKPQTPTIAHNAPFCEGTNNLTLSTQAYFGTDVRYIWTLPNGNLDTTLVPSLVLPNATVSDTGLYSLVIFVDGCLSLPGDAVIRIYPTPATPNVPADFAVCEGGDIMLTTTTVAMGYFWSGPNGFTSNLQSPTVLSANLVDAGTYSLNVTNTWGCRSLDTTVQVTVNSNPPAATITGSSPICFGDTLTLTSSSNCGQSQWIGPNGNSASTLGTPGGGNVLWTIGETTNIPSTDANYLSGDWYMICMDTITGCQSESNVLTIDITPIPSTPAAFNNSPVCVGGTVQLSTTTVNNGSYAWYADSTLTTLVATSQNPIITNITSDSTFYIVVTVNGCSSLAGSTTVTVHSVPATPNVPADFAVCAGDNIVLSTTTNGAGYNWTGPNGFSATLQNPSVVNATLIDSGTYTLFIVDANGCQSGDTSVQVAVNPNPVQPVLSSNSAICDGDSLVLSTTASATTFRWIAPNGADTLTSSSSLVLLSTSTFYQAGNWTLMTIDSNGCQSILSNPAAVIIHSIPAAQIVFNNGPVCSGSSVNLSTSFISGATYEWYSDAALTNLVATNQNPTINNITTDSTFYLVITVNGCTSAAGSTTVQVHPTPATPNVPANITACEGDALVLTTTTNASAYVWSGPNGFNSNQQSPTVISTASVIDSGTYTLYIIDANGCRSADTSVQVIVNPTPATAFIVSNNTPVCEGDDIILSANAGVLGTTYEWFNSLNVSVGTGQTLTIVGATTADAGDYYVITTVNACPSTASAVTTAMVDPIPNTAAFAGNDIGLCNTFAANLDATAPSNATGIWTTASGATIANPNLANTAVYNLPTGTSTFYWTLSNGACADFSIDSMVVDVTPVSTDVADAGLDQNLCGQVGATLVATTPTTATGQWSQSASQAGQGVVITNPTNPTTTVTGLQQGNNYSFTWTLSNGNCADYSSDMVQINVDVAPPDNAYAGVNILLCNQNVTNLDAFASQYGTGFWTSTSSATIIDPTLANTTVINLPQDTSVFVWTLSNGTCQNYSTDSVLVVVSSTTDTAEAGNNQVVCSVNALTLGATIPSAGIGTWSQTAAQAAQGVVLVDVNDPNTQVVGLNAGTTYAFTWTLTNGTCQDYSSDITTITVNTTPPDNAFAGNDINLCGVTTTTNLAASVPTVAIGFWTTTSTATISNPTQPGSTVSGLVVGQNIFVWTLSNGTCQDYDNDTIIITVTTPSADVADAGLDSAYCAQSVVTLNAAAPSVGGGYWSQTPSQASLGAVIDNPTDTSSTVSNLIGGVTYTFTWTLTNGGCVDYSSDEVLITIDVLPSNVAYAGEDTILCGGNAVQLAGLAPPIGTGFWTTNDTATVVTPVDPSSLVVNIGQDTTTYYWTLSNGACVDYSVDSVTVIISPASTDLAFAGFDDVLCVVDSITLSGGTPTTSTGLWTQSAGQSSQGVIITNPTDPNSTVTGIQTGQIYTFTWTLSTFGCANFSTDDVQYTINALPSEVAYAGPDIVLCSGNTVIMDATNPIFSTGIWSSNSTSIIVNPTLNNSSIVNIPTDTIAFYWALSNGSCIDYSIDTMLIIVTPTFSVDTANAGLDINLCNEDTAQLMAITPNIATGRWTQPFNQSSAGVVITDPNAALTTATGLQLDSSYTFTWSVSNGPCQDYDTDRMVVQVSALPTDAAYAGEDFVICGIDTAIVNATTPSIGTGLWTTASNAVIVTPPNTTTELLNLSIGTNEFVWTLSNGACRDYSSDTIVITMDSAPIANADSFVVIYNSNGTTIDVTPNDNLNNNWVITISESINSGTLTNLGTGEFELLLQDVLVDQSFIYQLCNPSCPAIYCDTALVIINVQGGTICNFPNMITPNNDDANETFIVPCLDGLEGTKFAVYNRWGDSIYENDNYKNDWGGTHNGAPVPDATYFYIMELADGQRFQGFVEVRR